jgi:hypothetical protein
MNSDERMKHVYTRENNKLPMLCLRIVIKINNTVLLHSCPKGKFR